MSGAGVAGPAFAWWARRRGLRAVEAAAGPRDGGQSVDPRGADRTVIARMGLEDAVRREGTGERGVLFRHTGRHDTPLPALAARLVSPPADAITLPDYPEP
ncbi:hypothetical protein [Streptomyces sp. NPDC046887]|uniref:hypothetical protein n=1 Tax=Streptomyces sp. NPDC046887 TaxID=3155472 RepID=UPI0033C96451